MNVISKPDKNFDFNTISLISPVVVSGGNHFIKIVSNQEPLYIQPPKCISKDGVINSGKKMFCDLVFDNENVEFVEWIEELNNHIQKNIFENRSKWFESDLDMHEIENFMISPLKPYKSGKMYLLRTTVPTRLGVCTLKIFDEFEETVSVEDIKSSTSMITILEVRGIKCSPRSFQIEIEIKQMMILTPNNMFEKCIIHPGIKSLAYIPQSDNEILKEDIINTNDGEIYTSNLICNAPEFDTTDSTAIDIKSDNSLAYYDISSCIIEHLSKERSLEKQCLSEVQNFDNIPILPSEEIEITEIDIVVPESETMQITTRNDIYYKMYKDAMRKAKNVRNLAISAYMNAKQIKNEYMIGDMINDEDSDLDDTSFDFDLGSELETCKDL